MKISQFSTVFVDDGKLRVYYNSPFYGLQKTIGKSDGGKPLKLLNNVEGEKFELIGDRFLVDGEPANTEFDHQFHHTHLKLGVEVAKVDDINAILALKFGIDMESPYGFARHVRFTHKLVATTNGEILCHTPNKFGINGAFLFEVFELIPRDTPCTIYVDFIDVNISWSDTVLRINRHDPLRFPNVHEILLSPHIDSVVIGEITIVSRRDF